MNPPVPSFKSRWFAPKNAYLFYLSLFLLTLLALSPYLKPLLTACFISYVLILPVGFIHRRLKLPRLLGVLALVALLCVLLGYTVFIFVPAALEEIRKLQEYLPTLLFNAETWLGDRSHFLEGRLGLHAAYLNWLSSQDSLWDFSELTTLKSLAEGSAVAFSTLFSAILVPVFVILLHAYYRQIGVFLLKCIPAHRQTDAKTFLRVAHHTLLHYFRGLGLVMLTLAVLYSISLSLFGIRNGVAIGIMSGFLIFIPYLGILFSAMVALMSASIYFEHWTQILGVLISYATFPLLDGFFLSPTFIGISVGMPVGLILVLLLIGGTWFGVLGALFAIPVAILFQVAWLLKTHPEKLEPFLKQQP